MKPAITVIVPIYNVEQYIHKSIESILSQTLSNIEIILVDDGSTDKSGEIADYYAKKDSRVKVIHKKNQGVSIARNLGLGLATGEYIGFIDPDDWIDNYMFEKLYCEAIQNNCDVVMCCFYREDMENNKNVKEFHPFESNRVLLKDNIKKEICSQLLMNSFFTAVWDKIYSRSFLEKYEIRLPDGIKLREDYIFNMDVFNFAERAKYLPIPFYHYRDTPNSALKKYYNNLFEFNLKIYNQKRMYSKKWFVGNQKYLNKVSYDFLIEVFRSTIQVHNKNNLDGIKNKWRDIYNIINHSKTREAILEYEKYIDSNEKINSIKIKLIKKKCIFLLNILSFVFNNISVVAKIKKFSSNISFEKLVKIFILK